MPLNWGISVALDTIRYFCPRVLASALKEKTVSFGRVRAELQETKTHLLSLIDQLDEALKEDANPEPKPESKPSEDGDQGDVIPAMGDPASSASLLVPGMGVSALLLGGLLRRRAE